jgi:hypothetical protein
MKGANSLPRATTGWPFTQISRAYSATTTLTEDGDSPFRRTLGEALRRRRCVAARRGSGHVGASDKANPDARPHTTLARRQICTPRRHQKTSLGGPAALCPRAKSAICKLAWARCGAADFTDVLLAVAVARFGVVGAVFGGGAFRGRRALFSAVCGSRWRRVLWRRWALAVSFGGAGRCRSGNQSPTRGRVANRL